VRIPIKQVVSSRIILVNKFLYQPHTERFDVQDGSALCITRQCGNVVNSFLMRVHSGNGL